MNLSNEAAQRDEVFATIFLRWGEGFFMEDEEGNAVGPEKKGCLP